LTVDILNADDGVDKLILLYGQNLQKR